VFDNRARAPGRFADLLSVPAQLPGWALNLVRAREHARAAVEKGVALVARMPGIVDPEALLLSARERLWQVETACGDPVAARVARWQHDAERLAMAHRLAAAYPKNQHWEIECYRAYFGARSAWRPGVDPPDWDILGQPAVIRALLNLAAVLADSPPGLTDDVRERGWDVRYKAANALRALDAKGLLPPEGKKLIEKLPPIEVLPPPREKE
jgi:hypothetical protein